MANKRVYARLEDDRIEQLDAECELREVYRPEIVSEAVRFFLDTNGGEVSETIEDLEDKCDAFKEKVDELQKINNLQKNEKDRLQGQCDAAKETIKELQDKCDAVEKQRNKFKDKFEQAVQTNQVLLARIRDLQGRGFFSRATGVTRINTDTYRVSGGSE